MSYSSLIAATLQMPPMPQLSPEWKVVDCGDGLMFPVVFSHARASRPFGDYPVYPRADCTLCRAVKDGQSNSHLVQDLEWLPAMYPIKSLHAICFPARHRAAFGADDICRLGAFVDVAGDAVACVNMRGSGASLPEHFHAQLHDCHVPQDVLGAGSGAFPLLSRPTEELSTAGPLRLARVSSYPTFALTVEGPWPLLGSWLTTYLTATNARPHNFALVGGGRLVVIPRAAERAPQQEHGYGASEMLGMLSPITRWAFDAISDANVVVEALGACGISGTKTREAVTEHAVWVLDHAGYSANGSRP